MKKEQIQEYNHRLATEVMGFHESPNTYQWDNHTRFVGKRDWQPHTNLDQAFMVADRICEMKGWEYCLDGTPIDSDFDFTFYESPNMLDVVKAEGARSLPDAIYAACVAALDQMDQQPEPKPEEPVKGKAKKKSLGIPMDCPHCGASPLLYDPNSSVRACLSCTNNPDVPVSTDPPNVSIGRDPGKCWNCGASPLMLEPDDVRNICMNCGKNPWAN